MDVKSIIRDKSEKSLFTIGEDDLAVDAIVALNRHRIGALLVVDAEGRLSGILSERDILTHFGPLLEKMRVKEIMTPREHLIIAHGEDDLNYCMAMFTRHRIRHLPVLDGESLVAVVSIGDVVKAMLEDIEHENKLLQDYIAGSFPTVS